MKHIEIKELGVNFDFPQNKIKTKWSKYQIPRCLDGRNHKWKDSLETGICLKCGYDVFDGCYKKKN